MQLHRIIKIRETWSSLKVLLKKVLLGKTKAACFVFVPNASRQPRLAPGTDSGKAALATTTVGNTGTGEGPSLGITEIQRASAFLRSLSQYHHLENIHLPVFYFANAFL